MLVDLTPAVLDLNLYAGDGEALLIDIVDSSSIPVDVSDRTWAAQWRPSRRSEDDLAVDLEVDDSEAGEGRIVVRFPSNVTRTLGAGVWDLQATVVGGEPETLAGGKVRVTLDVTR